MLFCALMVVINRNPVASALCLVVSLIMLAGLFTTLNALFIAVVQVLVYAGAVMVLFLFIVMLLDIKTEIRRRLNFLAVAACFVAVIGIFYKMYQGIASIPVSRGPVPHATVDVKLLGTELFRNYLLPFEITSLILLVALIGVVHLCKKEETL